MATLHNIDVGIIFCCVFVTQQTVAVHQCIFQEIKDIVELDTGKCLQWRHLHADSIDSSAGMILMMTLDQHGGQAKDSLSNTVEPLLTHTPRWTARAMGYERLWANRGMVKFEF